MLKLQLDIQVDTAQRLKKLFESLNDQEIFVQNFFEYQFEAGKLDDREDYMLWAGLYEMFCDNEQRLQEFV